MNEPSNTLSFSREGQRQVSGLVTGRSYENFILFSVGCEGFFFWFGFCLFCFVGTVNSLILLSKELLTVSYKDVSVELTLVPQAFLHCVSQGKK